MTFFRISKEEDNVYLERYYIEERLYIVMKKINQGYTYKIIEAKLVISGSTTSDALKSPTSISAANLLKRH